jgi:hypothetical protein
MNWEIVFKDAVAGVAGVIVYDKGSQDSLGRYIIAKTMRLASGHTLTKQSYRRQRPAAVRYAEKFLNQRAAKAGTEYKPGDGARTMLYAPVGVKGGAK